MTTKEKIIQLFEIKKELSVTEIVNEINASKQMVHLVLNTLIDNNFIDKIGRTPKTIYKLKVVTNKKATTTAIIPVEKQKFLQDNFILITINCMTFLTKLR
jgi:predicted transcriptional regulator